MGLFTIRPQPITFGNHEPKPIKNMPKKRKYAGRAQGSTQISLSLPKDLVAKVDKIADSQNRNRSNFIATALENRAKALGL